MRALGAACAKDLPEEADLHTLEVVAQYVLALFIYCT